MSSLSPPIRIQMNSANFRRPNCERLSHYVSVALCHLILAHYFKVFSPKLFVPMLMFTISSSPGGGGGGGWTCIDLSILVRAFSFRSVSLHYFGNYVIHSYILCQEIISFESFSVESPMCLKECIQFRYASIAIFFLYVIFNLTFKFTDRIE